MTKLFAVILASVIVIASAVISYTAASFLVRPERSMEKIGQQFGTTPIASVPGMADFIDPKFHFSFWYPSEWTIIQSATTSTMNDETYNRHDENDVVTEIRLRDRQGDTFFLDEVFSPSGYMFSPPVNGGCGLDYYYGASPRQWLLGTYGCDAVPTTTAQTNEFTVDKLPIFGGASPFESIVPLGDHTFIDITLVVATVDIQSDFRLESLPLVRSIQSLGTKSNSNAIIPAPVITAEQRYYAHVH